MVLSKDDDVDDQASTVAWSLYDNQHDVSDVKAFLIVVRAAGGVQQYLESALNKPEDITTFHDQLLQVSREQCVDERG